MPASIGVNLRVTGHCSQGGRKYMEDLFSVAYQQTEDERDLEYAFFGIYDGHGGSEAAAFAKEHLMDSIVKQRQFWSDDDEDVLKAIRNGYMLTHLNMWKELEKWPKTVTGLPSTAGTTASVAFIRRGKIYVGHVGDSAIVLGYQKEGSDEWAAKPLTLDHKPESTAEMERIQRCGGKVISKAGVPRVVWNRPRVGHKDPVKKTTPIDEIPFLAVARALGDLWSYNPQNDEFVVSPDPDVGVLTIDPMKFRCLIFGTDGLWNMISPEGAVNLVQATERHNEAALVTANGGQPKDWLNPSKSLVDHALQRWSNTRMRADNTSVVTLMLDPPGPPRAAVLRAKPPAQPPAHAPPPALAHRPHRPAPRTSLAPDSPAPALPQNGMTIMTRYSDVDKPPAPPDERLPPCASLAAPWKEPAEGDAITNYGNPAESYFMARLLHRSRVVNTLGDVYDDIAGVGESEEARGSSPAPQTALPEEPTPPEPVEPPAPVVTKPSDDVSIQINEVSSSSPTECPGRGRRGRRGEASGRVLRSHEAEPPRPVTRQTGRKPPAIERVVILNRSHVADQPARCTRSRDAVTVPAPVTSGNGPARRPAAPVPRRRAAPPPAPDCCKENRMTTRRRAAPPAPHPRPPRRPRAEPDSTTLGECARLQPPPPPPPPPRALRSRNEAPPVSAPPAAATKRTGAGKAPPPTARSLARRGAAPWAPALALRNRLRKRLAK